MNLIKSIGLMFLVFFGLWALVSLVLFGDVLLSAPILILTLAFSAAFGWRLYRRKYHATLSYDGHGFELQMGSQSWQASWTEFQRVSLFHEGFGQFAVRIYRDESDFVEIPTSALKMDSSEFRFEAMERVGATTRDRTG